MKTVAPRLTALAIAMACSHSAVAGTDIFFNPLTQSAAVASPNHINELNSPWQTPAGLSQENLTSMSEIEADVNQSVVRWDGSKGAAMFDMMTYDPSGQYLFIPHETFSGAGVSRYDIKNDFNEVLFSGDLNGPNGDWSNDFGAFDPARFTANGTVLLGEEWSGEGRVIEVLNPFAAPADIEYRELHSIANVSHEGIDFSKQDDRVMYYVDENRSGSIYKFVMDEAGDFTKGQTFVLSVNDFDGDPTLNYNQNDNTTVRTGMATWVPLTDEEGTPLTATNPFAAGQSNGRAAADEVNGTPYGRPEDTEVSTLANGNEVLYVAVTSETAVLAIEMTDEDTANVQYLVTADTMKNKGFPSTTGVLNSPDNLAQDALGNIYIIEDAPNSSDVGGDIWFVRDTNTDGVAESIDHFMSIQVNGSEATGMIFNPANPTEFVVAVQHPSSTNLSEVPDGFGDSVWRFDLTDIVAPVCEKKAQGWAHHWKQRGVRTCSHDADANFIKKLKRADRRDHRHDH